MTDKTPFHDVNRENLIAFFTGGEKYARTLGVEIEHVINRQNAGGTVSYFEPGGVRDILERLAPAYEKLTYEGDNLIALNKPKQAITIEPGGQIEISIGPCTTIVDVEREYLDFRAHLDPILDEFGLDTPMLGYNPAACARDIQLVPKFRYECMSDFLGKQAYASWCMMRCSASLQVSIDFEDDADAMRKLRLAEILAPILALICDNSPIFEAKERTNNIVRTKVWADMNQDRVGTVPGSLSRDFTMADYADYILSREAILVPDETSDNGWRYVGEQTFDELYADRAMTDTELEHALSMVWPDARLKNFVEIRPADAMPLEYALAYVLLIRGLFYSRRNLGVLESLLGEVDEEQVREAKVQLMGKGYGAEVYGRPAGFWADLLVVLASGALEPDEFVYFEPLASMVHYRFTLASVWPRLMEKRRHMPEGSPSAPVVGVVPRYDFEWTGLAVSDGYLSGLLETGCIPIVLPATSDPSHIASIVAACDGFLIPGGQDINPARYGCQRQVHTHRSATARDEMENALIRAVVAADKPLLGICRGMQSLNVALGGTLFQDVQESYPESDTVHVQGMPYDVPGHMVEIEEGSKLFACVGAPRIGVSSIHHQCVDRVGEGLVVVAQSPDDGVVEAIEMPDKKFVIGVQWHPEHMWRTRPHAKRLFQAFVDACKE